MSLWWCPLECEATQPISNSQARSPSPEDRPNAMADGPALVNFAKRTQADIMAVRMGRLALTTSYSWTHVRDQWGSRLASVSLLQILRKRANC